MPSKTDDKYTDPELHNVVKEEIQASDKGGAPGQWSARKAQMMASEYKKRGGDYTTEKKDESAKHLDQWTKEEWQTKEGSGNAKDANGLEHRYLPKKAWEQMDDKEKEATDAKKQEGSKEGKQHVENTSKAADAKKNASKDTNEFSKIDKKSITDCTTHWDDPEHMENNQKEYKKFMEENRKSKSTSPDDRPGKKRGQGANADLPSKKQKGSSEISDEPTAPTGDKTRVPQKGQKVQWHSAPGYISGEVVEVLYEEKEVDGKKVEASKEDPRLVLKTDSTGKICVHKPEAVYFD
ncbi:repeatdomain containing protein [Pyrenophora tritici-repentis]|uniref:DUF2945 domain containing protein n=2 Tax=Pyrenophora tritici-repentis TaxID=45151 RepID=A0A2W1FA55_9PLEO|nr:uncharacterized protein PTRG_07723 [Pyrenophora tritici-repentis Pt-1C-BFP]KAA8616957.1 DUF2945 domain-containing protein [Pyrenophora tritici-repentis]EDU50642.1 conserved hypothetical protein [Pyrenophora tritici-repentis Pt-1C-BFP]KAF7446249.1 DUF2945 domain containing protein [Pyrenophora tritici-repentis]KAF7567355.1 metal-dependent membrane protease [Pyrenophora tritici-repentis]KAG9381953.1 DUF2945 domain containing protein [Pyrenophora tritici-repentis]